MQTKTLNNSRTPLIAALILALLNGLIYVFMVPPWQHYDEPTHFEVAWWLANHQQPLEADDYDQSMRREVLMSMIEHGFFRGMGWVADPDVEDEPIWIGKYKQSDEPVLYYVSAAIPLFVLRGQDIDLQLYAARLVSLLWLLISIMAGYGVIVELTSPGNPLRWILPVSMALLPGYVDLMTAVNNDVGAIAASSLAVLISVRLVRKGLKPLSLVLAGMVIFLCVFTKETAYPAVIMLLLATILAGFMKSKYKGMAWLIIGSAVVILGLASFSGGDAAMWYRLTFQGSDTRLVLEDTAPLGKGVFRLEGGELEGSTWMNRLQQLITAEDIASMEGQAVTMGAWIWADRDGEKVRISLTAIMPDERAKQGSEVFTIRNEPAYYAFQAAMPEGTAQSWLTITAEGYGTFYLDGIVMAKGVYPLDQIPKPDNATNDTGRWGGISYDNILRGSSAEKSWPRVQTWVDRIGSKIFPDQGRPSLVIYSLLDWSAGGWYYDITLRNMQQTFWGKFGWGHIPLIKNQFYGLLEAIVWLSLVGIIVSIFTKGSVKKIPWDALIIMGIMMIIVWGLAIVRGSFYLFSWRFIPSARYAYPAIIPTLGLICCGWRRLGLGIKDFVWTRYMKKVPGWLGLVAYWLFVVGLNTLAILTVYQYYYG